MPPAHDGRSPFTFRIEFSEAVATSAADMRDHALTVTGGAVTGASRVKGRADVWRITVTPSGTGEIGIRLPSGRDCAEAGAVCTADGRRLSGGPAALIPGAAPLTAGFEGMPAEHRGEGGFRFRVAFNEDVGIGDRALREDAFTVTGAEATGTIENRDPMPRALLARFGRTAAVQVVEQVEALGGDVRTTMFGADYARGPLVVGLSPSNTRGLGEYSGPGSGRMLSSVTGLYPWLGYRATDRITVWGVTGYGVGGMLLTPGGGPALESGLSTAMAAAGTRGELVGGGGGNGLALAFKADALWAGTAIDGADGPEGRLVATSAAVTRVRAGLEGSRGFTFGGALSLRPSVEVGLRHDGGDAETGAGVDVGGGLVASHPSSGLAVDVRVRTLLVHEAEGFSERGVSLSLSWNPTPSTPLGLTARLAPSWGGQATSGADALWGRETMAGLGWAARRRCSTAPRRRGRRTASQARVRG